MQFVAGSDATVLAVADGMGGHEAGDVASGLAVAVVREAAPGLVDEDALRAAFYAAHTRIEAAARERTVTMGTTLTVAVLSGQQLLVAHVGDSRAYRVSSSGIDRLTTDHTQVHRLVEAGVVTPEEAERHPQRHVLERALGAGSTPQVDTLTVAVRPGDTVLLMTDGIHDVLADQHIARVVTTSGTMREACAALAGLAEAHGTGDNVTVVGVRGGAPATTAVTAVPTTARGRRRSRPRWIAVAGIFAAGFLLGVVARSALDGDPRPDTDDSSASAAGARQGAPTTAPPSTVAAPPAPVLTSLDCVKSPGSASLPTPAFVGGVAEAGTLEVARAFGRPEEPVVVPVRTLNNAAARTRFVDALRTAATRGPGVLVLQSGPVQQQLALSFAAESAGSLVVVVVPKAATVNLDDYPSATVVVRVEAPTSSKASFDRTGATSLVAVLDGSATCGI